MPGAVSRWNAKKDLSWVPLRPNWSWRSSTTSSRAVDFVTPASSSAGGPTGTPLSCTYDQLDVPVRYDLAEVLAG